MKEEKCNRFGVVSPYDPEFSEEYDEQERSIFGSD